MGTITRRITLKSPKSERNIQLCYYVPIVYLNALKSILPEMQDDSQTISNLFEDALTRQLMRDFNMINHLEYENLPNQQNTSKILTPKLLCEKCLMISAENIGVSQISIAGKKYCPSCALLELKDLLSQLLTIPEYNYDLFKRTFQFLDADFFNEIILKHMEKKVYEQKQSKPKESSHL